MKWFPDPRRMRSVGEAMAVIAAFGVLTPFVAALGSGLPAPALSEVAFRFLPALIAGSVVTAASFVAIGRGNRSASVAVALSAVSCAVAVLASVFGPWNEGRSFIVLPVRDALVSIATFGVLPLRYGPEAVLRFLPVCFAVGLAVMGKRSGAGMFRLAAVSVVSYLVLATTMHGMTWIAGGIAAANATTMETADGTFRTLVSAHADGYWTRVQGERFFLPVGRQAENAIETVRAALWFLVSAIALAFALAASARSPGSLVKRIGTRTAMLWIVHLVAGLSIGLGMRGARVSYTDGIALGVFFTVSLAWVSWWRFRRDIENLASDERERPDLPLPSGNVQAHDLKQASELLLGCALFGAFLLGYPVFIGFAAAALAAWLASRDGAAYRDGIVGDGVASLFIGLGLGWAGLSMGVRDAPTPEWGIRIVLALAVLAGVGRLFRNVQTRVESRTGHLTVAILGLIGAVLVARQRWFWIPAVAAGVGLLVLFQKPGKWHRYASWALDAARAGIVFILLFLPRAVSHL